MLVRALSVPVPSARGNSRRVLFARTFFSLPRRRVVRNTAMRLLAAILAGVFLTMAIHAAAKPSADTTAYDARESLAKLQAMDIFPEMEKEDSDFANAISTEVECLECEEPKFFKSPAWPLHVARRVAARLGVKPRTVAEIRKHLAETFDLDEDSFQQIHGIQIVSARLSVGGEVLDVTPQLAGRVTPRGFAADCDSGLVAALADETQFERSTDEKTADYWKRQRKLLGALAEARTGQEGLQITFEFQSETFTAAAKSGERLAISTEGKVSIVKIAPSARVVRTLAPAKSPAKPAKPAHISAPAIAPASVPEKRASAPMKPLFGGGKN